MAGIFNQLMCSSIAAFINLTMAILMFWPSSTIKLLNSEKTPLSRPMTDIEISLFTSAVSVGALIGNPIAGYIVDIVGRKWTAIMFASTHVVAWSLVAFFSQVEVVFLTTFLGGLGASVGMVVPNFISEICQENIRGTVTTFAINMYYVGMLVSYLLGGSLDYKTMIYAGLALSVIGTALLSFLKESPTYLMNKGLDEKAAKSFAFYRKDDIDSKVVQQEMEKLRRAFNPDFNDSKTIELNDLNKTPEEESLKNDLDTEQKTRMKLSFWTFVRKSYATRRAAFVTTTLFTATIFQGMLVVQVYARPIFEDAVPSISATLCTVLLAVTTIVMGTLTAYLTDRAGRRFLLIASSSSACLIGVLLGTQIHFNVAPSWATAALVYLYTAAYAFGCGPVPFLLLSEVFLPEVKSYMTMIIIQFLWCCDFITLFIFYPLVEAVGLGLVFYLFAGAGLTTLVITYFFLPETKGVSVDEMDVLFGRK